ncbi:MAG: ABC transporter ATP-binding protein [Rhodospirillales bacterium]|nr:ABC transporter ATP-binding protein [Rhodospirillales bacterium]
MKGLLIHGVSHAYGDNKVLDKVAVVVPAGELVCLLGPSGCGKSTLLRLAAGLEVLQEGSIVIDEVTVASNTMHMEPEDRRIGFMFQDYALFPHLNVLDNVSFGMFASSPQKARSRAMEMLKQVGMIDQVSKHPHMLSGGQQQRVALARALAPEPKLLLLDEPFSGLDTNMRARIREETLGVLKECGVATLMVTHDPEEAMFMADRIKILGADGRILQAARPHEIYYHPKHEFVAKLFGLMNRFDGIVSNSQVQTPLGCVAAPDMTEGLKVQVLIRPEGIVLESSEDAGGTPIELISTHLLGHDNVVRVRLVSGPHSELYVRVHHAFEPELALGIKATIDPDYAFVFPLAEGESQMEAAQ